MGNDRKDRVRLIGTFAMIPFVMAVPPVVGWYLGSWLDGLFGTSFVMYIFLVLGVLGGARECYRIIKEFGSEE
jgi:ATP synthase protein I